MTHIQAKIHASLETSASHAQAAAEGRALRGELGIDSQLLAMSELYRELLAAGDIKGARAVKARAVTINESRS